MLTGAERLEIFLGATAQWSRDAQRNAFDDRFSVIGINNGLALPPIIFIRIAAPPRKSRGKIIDTGKRQAKRRLRGIPCVTALTTKVLG